MFWGGIDKWRMKCRPFPPSRVTCEIGSSVLKSPGQLSQEGRKVGKKKGKGGPPLPPPDLLSPIQSVVVSPLPLSTRDVS